MNPTFLIPFNALLFRPYRFQMLLLQHLGRVRPTSFLLPRVLFRLLVRSFDLCFLDFDLPLFLLHFFLFLSRGLFFCFLLLANLNLFVLLLLAQG